MRQHKQLVCALFLVAIQYSFFSGASFGSAANGTGFKALEFALSMCNAVDMYGFTVDPSYKEWTRYFSESRQGHTPLLGRAYYQMMECLGVCKLYFCYCMYKSFRFFLES